MNEKINKHNLQKYTSRYVSKMVPQISSWTYTTLCTQHDIICVLYIVGCPKSNVDGTDNDNINNDNKNETKNKNRDNLREFRQLSRHGIEQFVEIEEAFHPKWIQFAYTRVSSSLNHELLELCVNSETQVILTNEGATTMTQMDNELSEQTNEEFWQWIKDNLEHESETTVC